MNNRNWLLVFAFAASFLFFACKKETTVVQPADPAVAKAVFSPWTPLSMSFAGKTDAGDSLYAQNIKADSLTQKVLDSGMVLSYLKLNTTGATTIVTTGLILTEIFTVGSIQLIGVGDYSGVPYRYIILHGGVRAGKVTSPSGVAYTKEQLQAMRYEDVMKLFGKNQ